MGHRPAGARGPPRSPVGARSERLARSHTVGLPVPAARASRPHTRERSPRPASVASIHPTGGPSSHAPRAPPEPVPARWRRATAVGASGEIVRYEPGAWNPVSLSVPYPSALWISQVIGRATAEIPRKLSCGLVNADAVSMRRMLLNGG